MPKYCGSEGVNVPDMELAQTLDMTNYYHVVPVPPLSVNVATNGHSLSGFPATFTALRSSSGGMWKIVGATTVPKGPSMGLPQLSVATGRIVTEDSSGVVFSGPILRIPLAVAEDADYLTGYGELFRILIGHNEELIEALRPDDQGTEVEQLLAGLINGDDVSVRKTISGNLSDDPDSVTGLIIDGTAMMFSRRCNETASQMQITNLSALTPNES
jgi:hypothetical protein